jgi:hypothetical protein
MRTARYADSSSMPVFLSWLMCCICPVRKPQRAVKRPVRPYKTATERMITAENAEAAYTPREGPDGHARELEDDLLLALHEGERETREVLPPRRAEAAVGRGAIFRQGGPRARARGGPRHGAAGGRLAVCWALRGLSGASLLDYGRRAGLGGFGRAPFWPPWLLH